MTADMRRCPACGARVRSVVEHVRVADNVPTIATVRWECTECDWRSDPPPGEDTGGCELNIHRPAVTRFSTTRTRWPRHPNR